MMRFSHVMLLAVGFVLAIDTVTSEETTTKGPTSEPEPTPEAEVTSGNDTLEDEGEGNATNPEPSVGSANSTTVVANSVSTTVATSSAVTTAAVTTAAVTTTVTPAALTTASSNGTDSNNTLPTPVQCHVNATVNCTSVVGKCFMAINTTNNFTMYGCMPYGVTVCPTGLNSYMKVTSGCHFCCDTADCNNRAYKTKDTLYALCMSGALDSLRFSIILVFTIMAVGHVIQHIML